MSVKLVNERGLVLNYEVFELPVLVQEVWRSIEGEIPDRKAVRFSVLCRLKGDPMICADRLQLGRALGEFTPECGEIFQRRGRDCGRMCPKRDEIMDFCKG